MLSNRKSHRASIFSLLLVLLYLSSCGVEYSRSLEKFPEGVSFTGRLSKLSYDPNEKRLVLNGYMTQEDRKEALVLSDDKMYRDAIDELFEWSNKEESSTKGFLTISAPKDLELIVTNVVDAFRKEYTEVEIRLLIRNNSQEVVRDIESKHSRAGFFYAHEAKRMVDAMEERKDIINSRIIYRDASCLITHPRNKQPYLTISELKEIFEGKITSWKSLMGENNPIKVFVVKESFYTKLIEDSLKVKMKEGVVSFCGDEKEVISRVKGAVGSIGIVGLSGIRYSLAIKKENRDTTSFKPIGIARSGKGSFYKPFQAYVLRKNYPFIADVGLVTMSRSGKLPIGFSGYVVNGNSGQSIFLSEGLVPMTQKIRVTEEK